jgi:hypothetical protein
VLTGGSAHWAMAKAPAVTLPVENLFAGLALVIFVQGLLRDLVALAQRASRPRGFITQIDEEAPTEMRSVDTKTSVRVRGAELNLCFESTAGVLLLGVAGFFLFVPRGTEVSVVPGALVTGAGAILLVGFFTRHLVLTIRAVPDHMNLPVYRAGSPGPKA